MLEEVEEEEADEEDEEEGGRRRMRRTTIRTRDRRSHGSIGHFLRDDTSWHQETVRCSCIGF